MEAKKKAKKTQKKVTKRKKKKRDDFSFPIEFRSWKILSPNVCVKEIDISVLLHKGSGIPIGIRSFFRIEKMKVGDRRRKVRLYHSVMCYEAFFVIDRPRSPRTQLRWNNPFSELLQKEFPKWPKAFSEDATPKVEAPKIRFVRKDVDSYDVEFINPSNI